MAMNADHYYGATAARYDQARMGKEGWRREQDAVKSLVTRGPILDVPLGTGRYLDIYQSKGLDVVGVDISADMIAEARRKQPDVNAIEGSIFDLPFDDGHFGTVVCSRMLNWFEPDRMDAAIKELRRVGREIVLSIRTGKEGQRPKGGNYTHDIARFYAAIDGLYIASKIEIRRYDDGVFQFFHLRAPTWKDVVGQFDWHPDGHGAIERLTKTWCARFGVAAVDLSKGRVSAEYWDHRRIEALLHTLQNAGGTRILTNDRPRFEDGPITIFRTQGREALIDGRRRANQRVRKPGVSPVLLIEA